MRHPEQAFHMTVAQYLDAALPAECWWTTFPAGGGGKARGGQLKAMGLKPGCGDILVLHEVATAASTSVLWIELKRRKGGKISPEQLAFAKRMNAFNDVTATFARTLEDVEHVLITEGIPLRARIMAGGAWAKVAA